VKSSSFKAVIFTIITALGLSLGGAAFAAVSGDVIGLRDFNTESTARLNTYTTDYGEETEDIEMLIVRVLQGPTSTDFILDGFPTQADALSIIWSQNSEEMYNGGIQGTPAPAAVPSPVGNGYALRVYATNYGYSIGPDSWRATDGDGNTGDFSFVATEYGQADAYSHTVSGPITVFFFDGDPNVYNPFARGYNYASVSAGDDYTSIPGDHGRSYPTALDALAHGTVTTPPIIQTYHKYYNNTQIVIDVIDENGDPHAASGDQGWMYAVYNLVGMDYVRDPNSKFIGYDDYMLQSDSVVMFAIGRYEDYDDYFPDIELSFR
jgi:hypothetical protein